MRSPFSPHYRKAKVTHLRWGLPTSDDTDTADSQVASCIRFDHRQAIHILQCHSSKVTKGQLKATKGKASPDTRGQSRSSWASHMAGLINSTQDDPVYHQRGLLKRRANNTSLKSPLSTSEKRKREVLGLNPFCGEGPKFKFTLALHRGERVIDERKRDLLKRQAKLKPPLSTPPSPICGE